MSFWKNRTSVETKSNYLNLPKHPLFTPHVAHHIAMILIILTYVTASIVRFGHVVCVTFKVNGETRMPD